MAHFNNTEDKQKLNAVRNNWRNQMKNKFPNFTEKKWAQTTYRTNHPQF